MCSVESQFSVRGSHHVMSGRSSLHLFLSGLLIVHVGVLNVRSLVRISLMLGIAECVLRRMGEGS